MKKIIYSFLLISIFLILNGSSCIKKDEDPTEPESPKEENVIGTIGTMQTGTVKTNSGYQISVIPGVVPQNQNGQSANVTFSIETPVTPPKQVSGTTQLKGDYTKLGPEGFVFRWPVEVTFPFKNSTDPTELKLL
ncbi:MAG: hypothetical protein GYA14_03575, partial [Ignavibacteria bacterium]|nr:hypothetical protein [Ignavibacteria bacterium]